MKAFDILNTTTEEFGGMYIITADDGYCMHLPEHDEQIYKGAVALQPTYDFSLVQVLAKEDVPEGAEIL